MPENDGQRLARLREEADRAYNDALTVLDRAIVSKPELPCPPVDFDDHQISLLNESWRLTPDAGLDMGTGWRGRLCRLVWPLIEPIVQRQQHFNALLIDHLNRNVAGEIESRTSVSALIAALDGHMDRLATLQSRLVQYLQRITLYVDTKDRDIAGGLSAAVGKTQDDFQQHAESLHLQTALTHAMKREVERLHAPPPLAVAGRPPRPTPDLDAYKYVCFEGVFRGSREEIVERQRTYLQYFKGTSDVLDVGCGRGEFLELLRERDIAARGIDANSEAVARCQERGLDATVADALGYLGTLGDESIGGLFSAQVVEHLEAEYLMRLLDVIHRTLRPGSHIVLETINPGVLDGVLQRVHTRPHPPTPSTPGHVELPPEGERIRGRRDRLQHTGP